MPSRGSLSLLATNPAEIALRVKIAPRAKTNPELKVKKEAGIAIEIGNNPEQAIAIETENSPEQAIAIEAVAKTVTVIKIEIVTAVAVGIAIETVTNQEAAIANKGEAGIAIVNGIKNHPDGESKLVSPRQREVASFRQNSSPTRVNFECGVQKAVLKGKNPKEIKSGHGLLKPIGKT